MLYVFLVESGTTLMFDMNLAMNHVALLQLNIEEVSKIEVEDQVLLISGGTALKSDCKVSSYTAGTDTNPIFLFARNNKDCSHGLPLDNSKATYASLEERLKACEILDVNPQNLQIKFQLARSLAEASDDELKICAQLVDTQHLQQQGWAALVANLEDHIKNLKKLFDLFLREMDRFFQSRPLYVNLLQNFSEIISRLDQMPLLPVFYPEGADKSARHTLLTKYASGPNQVLDEWACKYKDWILKLSEEKMLSLKHEVNKLLNSTLDPKLKEVGGIEERLFKLNELLQEARKYQMDQRKHEEILYSYHERMPPNCDQLDLIGLDKIHQVNLHLMLENHKRLMEKSSMCKNSKAEMSSNLCTRIAWVASIQNSIYQYENMFVLYLQQLERLNFHLHLIHQMRIAPEAYIKTLVEIRRRKVFSTNYLKWASNLSQQSSELHEKEVKKRKDFTATNPCPLFLHDLFPGMSDVPPPFATKCPEPFDVLLPEVTQEDLDFLKRTLPEFVSILEVPPPDVMPQTSHKSNVSDSAFSSEVPSSHGMAGPLHSSASLQSGQLFRTETLSSLGAGECANAVPEIFSPTSSPFEDPFLPSTDVESNLKHSKSGKTKKSDDSGVECKKLHLTETAEREMFSPIAEEQNNVESDGDEFERVDSVPKIYDPFEPTTASTDAQKPPEIKMAKSSTDGTTSQPDALSVQVDDMHLTLSEGFRSPESNMTSHDFQTADYFFDDSMPSSITESTGLSAMGKSPHMVKSHHVIVAEMQSKLNSKSQALVGVKGSHQMSRSADILKMHATMSALQSIVQDLREKFSSEFGVLREAVVMQQLAIQEDSSAVIEALSLLQFHAQKDKDEAVAAAENSFKEEQEKYVEMLKKAYLQLEVEAQKLTDAQREVELYQGQIYNLKTAIEDMKQEYDFQLQKVESDCKSQCEELKRGLMMEHELECENLREETSQKIQDKDDEIARLMEEISTKQTQIQMMIIEKENLEADLKGKLSREREQWAEVIHAQRVVPQKEVAVQSTDLQWPVETPTLEEMDVQENPNESEDGDGKSDPLVAAPQNEQLLHLFHVALFSIWDSLVLELGAKSQEDFRKKFVQQMKGCLRGTGEEAVKDHNAVLLNLLKEMQKNMCLESNIQDGDRSREPAVPFTQKDTVLCKKLIQAVELFGNSFDTIFRNAKVIENIASEREEAEKEKELLKKQREEDCGRFQEEIERLKSLHIAESQVSFNEAINKVTREKDEIISNLLSDKACLEKKHEAIKSAIGNCLDQPLVEASTADDPRALEQSQMVIRTLSEIREKMDLPDVLTLSTSSVDKSSSSLLEKLKSLEKELQKEKDKCQKILDKVSKTGHLKLSLVTCDPGDIVLFFYDEKHKNYVAFHFGNTLHFLHTNGLEVLELKIPPESPTDSWAIGVVTDKDYCLAKKKPNRYNVQHGSVFYRVRVKSWSRYKEMRSMMQLVLGTGELPVFRQTISEAEAAGTSESSQMSASTI